MIHSLVMREMRAVVPQVFEDVLDETDYLSQPSYSGIPDYIEYDGTAGTVEKYDVDGVSLGTDTLDGSSERVGRWRGRILWRLW